MWLISLLFFFLGENDSALEVTEAIQVQIVVGLQIVSRVDSRYDISFINYSYLSNMGAIFRWNGIEF